MAKQGERERDELRTLEDDEEMRRKSQHILSLSKKKITEESWLSQKQKRGLAVGVGPQHHILLFQIFGSRTDTLIEHITTTCFATTRKRIQI